jgi:hypothetical protein
MLSQSVCKKCMGVLWDFGAEEYWKRGAVTCPLRMVELGGSRFWRSSLYPIRDAPPPWCRFAVEHAAYGARAVVHVRKGKKGMLDKRICQRCLREVLIERIGERESAEWSRLDEEIWQAGKMRCFGFAYVSTAGEPPEDCLYRTEQYAVSSAKCEDEANQ